MLFCRACGDLVKPPFRPEKVYCSDACSAVARNRKRIKYKSLALWRYCGACGHTEEMHLGIDGNRNCMEEVGPDKSPDPYCGCLWRDIPCKPTSVAAVQDAQPDEPTTAPSTAKEDPPKPA